MANVVLKSDFRDGDLLFAQQLNNNFKAIQKALETMNSIIWQDNAEMVVTFRGTTEEINERDIIDGQILYDVLTGETYIDYDGKRISTGSGNAIHIGENEPTNPSTQIWIESDEVGNMLSEVVNSLDGNRTDKAPSVAAIRGLEAIVIGDLSLESENTEIGYPEGFNASNCIVESIMCRRKGNTTWGYGSTLDLASNATGNYLTRVILEEPSIQIRSKYVILADGAYPTVSRILGETEFRLVLKKIFNDEESEEAVDEV